MSQSQKIDLEVRGLYTSPNNLSGVPKGALQVADNIVINAKNVADSRRGQTQYGTELSTIGDEGINKLFNYASSLVVFYANKMAYDSGNGVWVDYQGFYSPPDQNYKIRSLEALKNFYFTTSEGIYKIDTLEGVPRPAGAPKGLGGTGVLTGSSGFLQDDSAVAYRLVWGYRDFNNNLIIGSPSQRLVVSNSSGGTRDVELTFTIPEAITTEYFYQIYRSFGTLTALSEPSDELQLVLEGNVTSAEIVANEFTVTDQVPFSLMRTTLYTSPSQEGIAQSNDEPPLALDMDIYKGSAFYANTRQKQRLTLSLISVDSPSFGYVTEASADTTLGDTTLTGIVDTSLLRTGMRIVGTGIFPNATIQEILSPTSVRMSDAATATGTVSVEFQDYFGINDNFKYFGGSFSNTDTFIVENGGTPAQNITQTTLNLLEAINKDPSGSWYGFYLSGTEDLPGQFLVEEREIGGEAFYLTSSAGSSFSEPLSNPFQIVSTSPGAVTTVTTEVDHNLSSGEDVYLWAELVPRDTYEVTVTGAKTFTIPYETTLSSSFGEYVLESSDLQVSSNDQRPNRVYISKPGQVEAVPPANFVDIGSANFPIQRVVALRDGIFFFKQDGIYRLSGETISNFIVTLIDNTVALRVPESAVAFNNQVFCFTTQGICAVTDSGVQIMSVPIEDTLLELSSEQFENFESASFGVAYESARLYLFFTVTKENDTFATQAFVYNALTDSWTRWVMNRTCGIVNTTINKLFMGRAGGGQVMIERKSFTNADYADEEYPVEITAVNSTTEVEIDSIENVVVGMTLVQGTRKALILNIDGLVLTTAPVNGLQVGGAIVYTPIKDVLEWLPIDADNPGILKQFSEITLFFKNAAFQQIDCIFSSNISIGTERVPVIARSPSGWGRFPWGQGVWGGELGGQAALRTYIPREKQRGSWILIRIETNEAFAGFSLQGISMMLNPMSSRFR